MIKLFIASTIILLATTTWGEEVGRLSVSLAAVDSLKLEMGLEQLWGQLDNMFRGTDRPELIRRKGLVTQNYLRLKHIRVELTLLDSIRTNRRAEYQLKCALAESAAGGVSDIQRLDAHNDYLSSELAFLTKQQECRNAILEIVQTCLLELTMSEEATREQIQKKAADLTTD